MKIAVWRTGHEIADTVAEAVWNGFLGKEDVVINDRNYLSYTDFHEIIEGNNIHIGYGILRGMDEVFRACEKAGKPWFNIDRGYWKPGHYDGYYRVSLNGTQQTFGLDKLEPDYERWDRLGIDIRDPLPLPFRECGPMLICPPTEHVKQFYGEWFAASGRETHLWRHKGCERALQEDLSKCSSVQTFNSSVGWEALRLGIPVVSDPNHSIVGAYQKLVDKNIHNDLDERRKFFSIQCHLQQTLNEMRQGLLWPLLQELLSLEKK